jgi:predicted amidohydrolase
VKKQSISCFFHLRNLTFVAENTKIQMKITLLQTEISWNDPETNRRRAEGMMRKAEKSDVYVLPEMFSTGFATQPEGIAEEDEGSLRWMMKMAKELDAAVVGSITTKVEEGVFCNRMYFVKPDGMVSFYDKRHLFSYAGEDKRYKAGKERKVVEFRGVRFLLQVCYDLRYPLWARNRGDYDCILYSANFPISRDTAWRTLIRARASENQCYVAACNRIGTDQQCEYYGRSAIIHPYGETIMDCPDKTEWAASAVIDLDFLRHYENKFPVLDDADDFELKS